MRKINDLLNLDIETIEPVDVTPFEKAKLKKHVMQNSRKKHMNLWRSLTAAAIITIGCTATAGFAFPSVASQIPFMEHVISYFNDDNKYVGFEQFSTDIGLVQTSNGVTMMIDDAVYDGTTVTISFAIESEKNLGEQVKFRMPHRLDIGNASGLGGYTNIEKISDTRYVGIASYTPIFESGTSPEQVQVSWKPTTLIDYNNTPQLEGDWSFEFSLSRITGETQLVNEAISKDGVTLVIQSVEQTGLSTVIKYEQTINEAVNKKWEDVSPIFTITDDLGNHYGADGGGASSKDHGITYNGTLTINKVDERATKLFVEPIAILSKLSGKGHEQLPMETIEIELTE
ncbi:DUF4179 domain-containing protein [Metabacillus malikii]|uniref:DUF4179 domain-containing protein n=1 Tax=Metabacillus malikii TaxID=1504265 RepID=A0ABT9ZMH9_9BACI|nr:DUF4179 domain-containing protein [Metabacillus malikii]MDQ0233488.1 hypothetical protein [Metabacillus malikii]